MFLATKIKKSNTTKCANIHSQVSSDKEGAAKQTPGVLTGEHMAPMKARGGQAQASTSSQMHTNGSNSMRRTLKGGKNHRDSIHIIEIRMAKSTTTIQRALLEEETQMISSTTSSAGKRSYLGKEWTVRKRRA
jgi:hypothetical protein